MKKSGFTLIELMVVISIIAILTLAGVVSYTQVLKNGRDAKRQTDLKILQSALEQYRADVGFYPTKIPVKDTPFTNLTGQPPSSVPPPLKTYINKTPGDNNNTTPYVYKSFRDIGGGSCDNSGTKCFTYCLYANVENGGLNTLQPNLCNTYKPSGYDFVVTTP